MKCEDCFGESEQLVVLNSEQVEHPTAEGSNEPSSDPKGNHSTTHNT